MVNFFEELKNRNVNKIASAYAVSGWLIMQVVNTIGNNLGRPNGIVAKMSDFPLPWSSPGCMNLHLRG